MTNRKLDEIRNLVLPVMRILDLISIEEEEKLNEDVIELAIKSSRLLNIDFCGVDIIEYKRQYYVIEVNSIPAWKGLQKVESANISDYITSLFA